MVIQCNTGVGTPLYEGVSVLQEVYFSGIILLVIVAWAAMHSCDPRRGSIQKEPPRRTKYFSPNSLTSENTFHENWFFRGSIKGK